MPQRAAYLFCVFYGIKGAFAIQIEGCDTPFYIARLNFVPIQPLRCRWGATHPFSNNRCHCEHFALLGINSAKQSSSSCHSRVGGNLYL